MYTIVNLFKASNIDAKKKNAFRQIYLYNLPEHKFISKKKTRENKNQTITNQVQNLNLFEF